MTSDQHLGYLHSDKASFNRFLDELAGQSDVTHLVLLGDFVDMWRRDASGVFLEAHDTVAKLLALKAKGVQVSYVAGNHDYHVLDLDRPKYPVPIVKDLTLTDGGVIYRLVHGHEFDPEQKVPLMAFLCRVMSDTGGPLEDHIWTDLNRVSSILGKMEPSFLKADIAAFSDRLRRGPENRLADGSLGRINATACKQARPGEILVFGHTHVPFVNTAGNVVNSGSWVKDANPSNTYVELSNGKARLFIYGDKRQEITERKDW